MKLSFTNMEIHVKICLISSPFQNLKLRFDNVHLIFRIAKLEAQ